MNFEFPYRLQPDTDPSPAAPNEPVYRPKIPVRLTGPTNEQSLTFALVDTGADETVVPFKLAKLLRVKLGSKVYALYGASGRPFQVRYGIVELSIGNGASVYSWKAKVAFQKERRNSVVGRAGCLDLFEVLFDGPNRKVIITTP